MIHTMMIERTETNSEKRNERNAPLLYLRMPFANGAKAVEQCTLACVDAFEVCDLLNC